MSVQPPLQPSDPSKYIFSGQHAANQEQTGIHVGDNSNTVISGRAPRRMGGPVVPMPRLTYSWLPRFSYLPLT